MRSMDVHTVPDLSVSLGRIHLKNPVLVASGTFGYGEEYEDFVESEELGGIITKAVTLEPREGNPPPRLAETPAGLLNSIGLENPGIEVFLTEKLPKLRKLKTRIIVNIAGEKKTEYLDLAEKLDRETGIDALEVNISCPNVQRGGVVFGTRADLAFSLVKGLRQATNLPLIVKLTPNVTDITEIAQAAKEGGADALSLINTILGMAIDVNTRRPRIGAITGGLSGPAIRPIAVRMVHQTHQNVDLPLIGVGGITSCEDALEFVLAGATAVAVGTANFVDPVVSLEIIEGLREYLKRWGVHSYQSLVGGLRT